MNIATEQPSIEDEYEALQFLMGEAAGEILALSEVITELNRLGFTTNVVERSRSAQRRYVPFWVDDSEVILDL